MEEQKKYYIYQAERKFLWQDLAELFGYHACALHQLNSKIGKIIQKGDKILFPYKRCNTAFFYQMFEEQSLIGLSRALGIDESQVLHMNPGIRYDRFVQGQTILLPINRKDYNNAQIKEEKVGKETLGERLFKAKLTIELLELFNTGKNIMQMQPGQTYFRIYWDEETKT